MNKVSVIISITLHLLVILLLSLDVGNKAAESQSNGDQTEVVQVDVIPKAAQAESEKPIELDGTEITKQNSKKPGEDLDENCTGKHWYGGVGIGMVVENGRIFSTIKNVFPGYPADIAGIIPGDVILKPQPGQITGDPGTPVEIIVQRNSSLLRFNMKRAKICY